MLSGTLATHFSQHIVETQGCEELKPHFLGYDEKKGSFKAGISYLDKSVRANIVSYEKTHSSVLSQTFKLDKSVRANIASYEKAYSSILLRAFKYVFDNPYIEGHLIPADRLPIIADSAFFKITTSDNDNNHAGSQYLMFVLKKLPEYYKRTISAQSVLQALLKAKDIGAVINKEVKLENIKLPVRPIDYVILKRDFASFELLVAAGAENNLDYLNLQRFNEAKISDTLFKKIIQNHQNRNIQTGKALIDIAADKGHYRFLIRIGCLFPETTKELKEAIKLSGNFADYAIEHKDFESLKKLIDYGAKNNTGYCKLLRFFMDKVTDEHLKLIITNHNYPDYASGEAIINKAIEDRDMDFLEAIKRIFPGQEQFINTKIMQNGGNESLVKIQNRKNAIRLLREITPTLDYHIEGRRSIFSDNVDFPKFKEQMKKADGYANVLRDEKNCAVYNDYVKRLNDLLFGAIACEMRNILVIELLMESPAMESKLGEVDLFKRIVDHCNDFRRKDAWLLERLLTTKKIKFPTTLPPKQLSEFALNAISYKNPALLKIFIKHHVKNNCGYEQLARLIQNPKNQELIQLILQSHQDINAPLENGLTMAEQAMLEGNTELLAVLGKAGVPLNRALALGGLKAIESVASATREDKNFGLVLNQYKDDTRLLTLGLHDLVLDLVNDKLTEYALWKFARYPRFKEVLLAFILTLPEKTQTYILNLAVEKVNNTPNSFYTIWHTARKDNNKAPDFTRGALKNVFQAYQKVAAFSSTDNMDQIKAQVVSEVSAVRDALKEECNILTLVESQTLALEVKETNKKALTPEQNFLLIETAILSSPEHALGVFSKIEEKDTHVFAIAGSKRLAKLKKDIRTLKNPEGGPMDGVLKVSKALEKQTESKQEQKNMSGLLTAIREKNISAARLENILTHFADFPARVLAYLATLSAEEEFTELQQALTNKGNALTPIFVGKGSVFASSAYSRMLQLQKQLSKEAKVGTMTQSILPSEVLLIEFQRLQVSYEKEFKKSDIEKQAQLMEQIKVCKQCIATIDKSGTAIAQADLQTWKKMKLFKGSEWYNQLQTNELGSAVEKLLTLKSSTLSVTEGSIPGDDSKAVPGIPISVPSYYLPPEGYQLPPSQVPDNVQHPVRDSSGLVGLETTTTATVTMSLLESQPNLVLASSSKTREKPGVDSSTSISSLSTASSILLSNNSFVIEKGSSRRSVCQEMVSMRCKI